MNAIVDPNQDTEFHDALRKHGIIPEKPPSRSPSPELPTAAEQRQASLQNATLDELDRALEFDGSGSGNDDEERILLQLRQRRMDALARERARGKFGRVYPIARPDYTREVTEASKAHPSRRGDGRGEGGSGDEDDEEDADDDDGRAETGAGTVYAQATATAKPPSQQQGQPARARARPKGTGVVCFLYKDGIDECRLLAGYLDHLAEKYPATKFVSIVGDQCIPNYPDRNLPTLLVYRNGELHRQIVGLRPEIGLDGMRTKCQDIELLLTAVGAIERSVIPGSSTHPDAAGQYDGGGGGGKEEEDKDARRQERQEARQDEDEGFAGSNRQYARPSVRSQEEEDDDDLDWDL